MWPQCLPPSLGSIWLRVPEQTWFQDFQDGSPPRRPNWIARCNDFSNSESLWRSLASLQVSAQSNLRFKRRCCLKNFKMATILAILNLYVAPMPPIEFRLNPTYSLGDVVRRISRWRPSWISEQNNFSNSESLCCCDASHQVSAQSDLWFGRRCRLKYFKMAVMVAILDIGMERF